MKTSPILRPLLGMAVASAAILCTAGPLRAGLVLEQTVEGSEARNETVMRIQGGMVRADICEELSTIANTKDREVMTVMHPAREVTVMRQPAAAADNTTTPPMVPKYTVTGLTEKVNGYDCVVVTMEVLGMKSTFWVAKSYPDYDRIKAELATVKSASDTTALPPEMDGMILKSCTGSESFPCITTVKSVRFEEIPDSAFRAPAGYTITRAAD
ncbi:DUF4412 domain-containing protein [Verrucomicrobium sp. BvORR034]|jgi:hypothetical protein|uniref:DUF4412 domain-containing protein n=1 Tax=Verrucomicrobium sp. BvORR034 TaxID=1396418 RepID=UPI0006797AD7|nr:DUF4412 domain-containing protein [Verrucomicrobium sp. BvORR034]